MSNHPPPARDLTRRAERPVAAAAMSTTSAPHYTWGDGCDGWRLVDRPGLSIVEERIPPGGGEVWHLHEQAVQFFYVLRGQAVMEMPRNSVDLGPGAGLTVLPHVAHRIANVGAEDLLLLVTSAPSTRTDRITVRG